MSIIATNQREQDSDGLQYQYNECIELLKKYHLGYDAVNKNIYCSTCKGVVSIHFETHMRRNHAKITNMSHVKKIKETLVILPFSCDFKMQQTEREYLKTIKGYQCNSCGWCCTVLRRMKGHRSKCHPNATYKECWVQSADLGNCKKYFSVVLTHPQKNDDAFIIQEKEIQNTIQQSIAVLETNDIPAETWRSRNTLYSRFGWFVDDAELENYKSLGLLRYFECPPELILYKDQVAQYLSEFVDGVKDWDVFYKKLLSVDKVNHWISYLNHPNSRRDYVCFFIRMIYFSCNFCCRPITWYMELKHDIKQACTQMISDFNQSTFLTFAYLLIGEKIETCGKANCILVIFLRLLCVEINYAQTQHLHRNTGQMDHPSKVNDHRVENDLQSTSPNVVYQLVAPGKFAKFCTKVTYFMKMIGYLYCTKVHEKGLDQLPKVLQIINGEDFYFSAALSVLSKDATRISRHTRALPLIIESVPGMKIDMKGVSIDFKNISKCYSNMFDAIDDIVNQLTFGLNIQINPKHIVDDFGNQRPGYSMHFKKHWETTKMNGLIIHHILRTPNLGQKYISRVHQGKIEWNKKVIEQYIKLYDIFINHLCFMIHFVSGMPARSSELTSYRRKNGLSSTRSVHIAFENVLLLSEYTKTNHFTGVARNIVRFLDAKSTSVFLIDFFVIRPFICVICQECQKNVDNIYSNDLFVLNGKKMSDIQARGNFEHLFQKYSGIPLQFQMFRHFAKYISNQIDIMEGSMGQSSSGIHGKQKNLSFSDQMGHSHLVGQMNYAIVMGSHDRVDDIDLRRFRTCSQLWHRFITQGSLNFISKTKQQTSSLISTRQNKRKDSSKEFHPQKKKKINPQNQHTKQTNHQIRRFEQEDQHNDSEMLPSQRDHNSNSIPFCFGIPLSNSKISNRLNQKKQNKKKRNSLHRQSVDGLVYRGDHNDRQDINGEDFSVDEEDHAHVEDDAGHEFDDTEHEFDDPTHGIDDTTHGVDDPTHRVDDQEQESLF
eukprot:TRINITY_DN1637_c0_g1_i11.p1 TRINITY_DN1637_c0_g1~~TRINITY_DN1637_c0_g1_i11.p1  ORF type:complete len:998 (+),score=150.30 TRINITY_DN1637_c0_g1_i11:506-3499(+)